MRNGCCHGTAKCHHHTTFAAALDQLRLVRRPTWNCFAASTPVVRRSAVSNGTAPYSYTWNTITRAEQRCGDQPAAGTWTCTITDANGCYDHAERDHHTTCRCAGDSSVERSDQRGMLRRKLPVAPQSLLPTEPHPIPTAGTRCRYRTRQRQEPCRWNLDLHRHRCQRMFHNAQRHHHTTCRRRLQPDRYCHTCHLRRCCQRCRGCNDQRRYRAILPLPGPGPTGSSSAAVDISRTGVRRLHLHRLRCQRLFHQFPELQCGSTRLVQPSAEPPA
jgi:hypothetical protein